MPKFKFTVTREIATSTPSRVVQSCERLADVFLRTRIPRAIESDFIWVGQAGYVKGRFDRMKETFTYEGEVDSQEFISMLQAYCMGHLEKWLATYLELHPDMFPKLYTQAQQQSL